MQQYDPDLKEQKEDSSSDDGPEPKPEFEFKFDVDSSIFSSAKYIFIATYGPQQIYLKNSFTTVSGKINFSKATQSALATIYKNEESVAIIFNQEINDYHYTDYNFAFTLFQHIPQEKQRLIQFVVLTNSSSQALLVAKDQNYYLRKIATNQNKLKLEQIDPLETPNEFQGLFADIFSELQVRQCQAIGAILVHQDYEVQASSVEAFKVLEQQFPFLKLQTSKNAVQEDIKKMNRDKNKNTLYL